MVEGNRESIRQGRLVVKEYMKRIRQARLEEEEELGKVRRGLGRLDWKRKKQERGGED